MLDRIKIRSVISGISRRKSRFESSIFLTILTSTLFEISKTRFLGTVSDYFLKKIAGLKENDNFKFAVGLQLYTKGRHQKANTVFNEIRDFTNLTQRALYLIALCASWQMNLSILERIKSESKSESLKFFLKGLTLHKSSTKESTDSFMRVYESYLRENPETTKHQYLPEYVRNSINVSKPIPQTLIPLCQDSLLLHLEFNEAHSTEMQMDSSDLILISYTSSYLFALSEVVIGRIRKKNTFAILLIITISDLEDTSTIYIFCKKLAKKYGKVFWRIVISDFDLPVLSTVIRLVIVQRLFEKQQINSILIIDGDTSFIHVDPVQVWSSIGRSFDIALLQSDSLCPWERVSLGFSVFNNTERTKLFLSQFDLYVTKHLTDNLAFWTLDQTAAFQVLQEIRQCGQETGASSIDVLDLSALVSLSEFIAMDRKLVSLKLKAKISNPAFIAQMSESLYPT